MTVAELIEVLKTMPQELPVAYNNDGEWVVVGLVEAPDDKIYYWNCETNKLEKERVVVVA